jgi:NitT/TauT family transport system ATP-binding protein
MLGAAATGHVSISNVVKSYDQAPVVGDCSFEIEENRFTALVGPSGCGKTTIINLIAGYETPDAGTIALDHAPVGGPASDRLVVFQETALFPWKSTLKNVMFGPVNRGMSKPDAERSARDLLRRFGLSGFETKYPSQLSGGMQRRAELARALINSPKVMLMDEPFRGLDAMTRELMQEYLLRVFEEHRVTTLFVTTEIEEAIYLADRVIVLSNRPSEVKRVLDVNLPRPRHIHMLSTPEFGRIHGEILEILFQEGSKFFGRTAGEADDILKGAASLLEGYRHSR